MFALVDCNNFYASCERAFYQLYGDMSNRVMSMLSGYSHNIEVYSIDEAFLDFRGFRLYNLKEYGEEIVRSVTKGTGIPISIGMADTKTLAKVANKFAKKFKGYRGACIINTEEKRIEALKRTEIGDVWGIGHRHAKRLEEYGIHNAYEFSQMPKGWVRQQMTVVGERIWKELNGESCIDLELVTPAKKQICTSRAFGQTITEIDELEEVVSSFAGICAGKLRKQHSCARSLMVFIHTNNFREDLPQYFQNCVIKLPVPTSDTSEIVHYALVALRNIYRKGYWYKKAGVIIMTQASNSHSTR